MKKRIELNTSEEDLYRAVIVGDDSKIPEHAARALEEIFRARREKFGTIILNSEQLKQI